MYKSYDSMPSKYSSYVDKTSIVTVFIWHMSQFETPHLNCAHFLSSCCDLYRHQAIPLKIHTPTER